VALLSPRVFDAESEPVPWLRNNLELRVFPVGMLPSESRFPKTVIKIKLGWNQSGNKTSETQENKGGVFPVERIVAEYVAMPREAEVSNKQV
jgi:hypothetical protein